MTLASRRLGSGGVDSTTALHHEVALHTGEEVALDLCGDGVPGDTFCAVN
jgi:hypothetical protein